jgi:putative ATP-dependent endonuclease of the OLD family
MRLASAHVQGYRCVKDKVIDFGDLTALVGSGGVGKSAFLRAIDWCINDLPLDEADLYRDPEGRAAEAIVVTLTLDRLESHDRDVLGRHGAGETTTIIRSWRPGEEAKFSGSAYFFPGFDGVRKAKGAQRRRLYQELWGQEGRVRGFVQPMAKTVAEVNEHMDRYERENPGECEPRPAAAGHLVGFGGGPKLRECFEYVFVSADTDAPDAFGLGRGSPLSRLLANIGGLDVSAQEEVDRLQKETQAKLSDIFGSARNEALKQIADGITERVRDYVPAAAVELEEELKPPRPLEAEPIVKVINDGGYPTDVERQGHGLQRTLVIAVLQELADALSANGSSGRKPPPTKSLMLAIEEPELYQHPLQARTLAVALRDLGAGDSETRAPQIAYSTHSEHFVRPTLFEDLRIISRNDSGASSVVATDPGAVQRALKAVGLVDQERQVRLTLASSLSQAVFAKGVVLCEGKTDAAMLEAVAAVDRPLEHDGIAVANCHGKSIIPIALAILAEFEIPTFVLFDADAQARSRLEENDKLSGYAREKAIESIATKNEQLLALCGEPPAPWPSAEVREKSANFAGNSESDTGDIWPAFIQARDRVAGKLGISVKSAEAYRLAAEQAGDAPQFFVELLTEVRALA